MSRLLTPSALALAIFSISHAYANANNGATTASPLPTIVVTASKLPEPIHNVPARISVINEKTIQQSTIGNLNQQLQQEAALNVVQSGGMGQQSSIFTRGTNSNHTLVLNDGMRTNTATLSAANINLFDLSGVSQIEVLKGPASVQYGSDAIGGVINLVSHVPTKQRLFTTLEGGEQNTYKASIGADLVEEDAYFQIRGQRLETDGSPVTNSPNAKDASYDQIGYSVKGGIDNELYAVSAQLQENQGNVAYNPLLTGNQDFTNRVINLKGRYNINAAVSVNARYSEFKDELDQTTSPDYAHTNSKETDLNMQWRFVPNQNVLLGLTHRNTDANYVSLSSWGDTIYHETLKTTGYYLQHQYQQDGLSTQAGIRVEDDDKYGSQTVGQLAARVQVAPLTSVYANIGTAFHAPDANQLYGGSSANPNLTAEESVSYEIGLDQQFNHGLTGYLSVYQTSVKDLISYNNNFQLENIQKAKLTGGELGIKWAKDAWFAHAEYAYVQPKNESTNKELTRRPRQTATLSAGWDNGTMGASVSVLAKSKAKEFSASNPTAGFVSTNLNGFYHINPHVKVFANIQNIGNTGYKTALYNTMPSVEYYVAAERIASAGITLSY